MTQVSNSTGAQYIATLNCDFDILEFKGGVKPEKKRAYYGNSGKDITDRDRQAMYNFSKEGIPLHTIAENYGCSFSYVHEVINTRPWLHPAPKEDNFVNMTWMESDHSDPLELVKIFFYEEGDTPEITVKEKREEMTWQEYYETVDWGEAYRCGEGALEVIRAEADRLSNLQRNKQTA